MIHRNVNIRLDEGYWTIFREGERYTVLPILLLIYFDSIMIVNVIMLPFFRIGGITFRLCYMRDSDCLYTLLIDTFSLDYAEIFNKIVFVIL